MQATKPKIPDEQIFIMCFIFAIVVMVVYDWAERKTQATAKIECQQTQHESTPRS